MRIVSIEERPVSDYGRRWLVTAEHGGREYAKSVVLKSVNYYRNWDSFRHAFAKAMRELDRDIAFAEHGKDFRDHCRLKSNFWGALTEDESTQQFVRAIDAYVTQLESAAVS